MSEYSNKIKLKLFFLFLLYISITQDNASYASGALELDSDFIKQVKHLNPNFAAANQNTNRSLNSPQNFQANDLNESLNQVIDSEKNTQQKINNKKINDENLATTPNQTKLLDTRNDQNNHQDNQIKKDIALIDEIINNKKDQDNLKISKKQNQVDTQSSKNKALNEKEPSPLINTAVEYKKSNSSILETGTETGTETEAQQELQQEQKPDQDPSRNQSQNQNLKKEQGQNQEQKEKQNQNKNQNQSHTKKEFAKKSETFIQKTNNSEKTIKELDNTDSNNNNETNTRNKDPHLTKQSSYQSAEENKKNTTNSPNQTKDINQHSPNNKKHLPNNTNNFRKPSQEEREAMEEILVEKSEEVMHRPVLNYRKVEQPSAIEKRHYGSQNTHLPPVFEQDKYSALLFVAVNKDKIPEIKALLNKGAKLDIQDKRNGYTPLIYAAKNNKINALRYLIINNAKINVLSYNGRTALHLAIINEAKAAIEILMNKGASLEICDRKGKRPMAYLNNQFNSKFIKQAIDRYHNISKALIDMIIIGNIDGVKYAISKGANINYQDPNLNGNTPLIISIMNRYNKIFDLLVQNYSIDIYKCNYSKVCPLVAAQQVKNNYLVSALQTLMIQKDLENLSRKKDTKK